jgi:hypothetical protein
VCSNANKRALLEPKELLLMHEHCKELLQEKESLKHIIADHREGILECAHDYDHTRFELDTLESNFEKIGDIADDKERGTVRIPA